MGGESVTVSNEKSVTKHPSPENPSKWHFLPTYHHNGRLVTKGIEPDGESGRAGFHPYHFLRVAWRSSTKVNSVLNIFWPFSIAAIVLYFSRADARATFAVSFLGIIPAAGLLDFSGAQFARKIPRVVGIVVETLFGGVVEIVLFMILIARHDPAHGHNNIPVIQAAILGSILANLLLCLGCCFLVGGFKYKEQKFHKVVSETGSGILLVAGFALLIPSAFYSALRTAVVADGSAGYTPEDLRKDVYHISKGTSIILMFAFFMYLGFNMFSHDSIFDEVLTKDEERDRDREEDLAKSRFTMTEAILGILIGLTFVSFCAFFLVDRLEIIVEEHGLRETFMGLILIPLVEKFAEHLSAVDEAYDNQINFALYHCLGPSIQTALFNAPLVVFVGWGLNKQMDLNFEIFIAVCLVLAILVVGNFLRDGSSDWLEGSLLVMVYLIIAVAAFWYPDSKDISTNFLISSSPESGGEEIVNATEHAVEHAVEIVKRLIAAGQIPALL